MITKKRTEMKCWCSKAGLTLNAMPIISCCKNVSGEINARHDSIVNILVNNIPVKRDIIHEQKLDDKKMVRTARDQITIGTEHRMSDELRK